MATAEWAGRKSAVEPPIKAKPMPQAVEWRWQHSRPALNDGEIHIWRASLAPDASTLSRLAGYLSDDEQRRAARFHFERDRDRFILARGALRAILSMYLGGVPSAIRFQYGEQSKPAVPAGANGRTLGFNLSHSDDLAICAVGWNRNIGVDVEKVRGDFASEEIARRYFSPTEHEALMALPPGLRSEGFFACWTRKEAYIKARGGGMNIPLDSFEVTLDPRSSARFVRGIDPSWRLAVFTAGPGFPAALVCDGAPAELQFLAFNPATDLS